MKIKELEKYVVKALEESEATRKDDFVLYAYVLAEKGVPLYQQLGEYLFTAKRDKMPAFESVSRCRRHIQELRPDLKDMKTAIAREEKQDDFIEYNLSGIGE